MPAKKTAVKPQTIARKPSAPAELAEKTLGRIAVLVFFLLPLVFYYKYLFGNNMLYGTDWLGAGGYAIREFMARYISAHGWIAYWMPAILSGQPTGAAFFADLFYPTLLARLVLPVHVVWTWTFVFHLSLAGLGTYLFVRELRTGVIPAFLAGVAYMFAGSLVTLTFAGHDGRLIGSALLPLALFFLHRGMTRQKFAYFVLTGLILGLQLLSGHIQKVYYTGLVLTAYFLFQLINLVRQTRYAAAGLKLVGFFLFSLGFAAALCAVQYLPIMQNMPYASRGSERGYEYATSWSLPIIETLDLISPRFSGGLDAYWGKNPFKLHSEYLGILPLLCALIAVFRRWKDRFTRFFTFSFLATLLLAWGGNTPLYYIPYYLFPGVSKFRGPAMIFFACAFSIVVLAGLGLDYLFRQLQDRTAAGKAIQPALIGSSAFTLLLLLFAALREPMLALLRSGTVQTENKLAALSAHYPALVNGFLLASVFAIGGFLLIWLLSRGLLRPLSFSVLAACLMVLDIGISLRLWDSEKGYIRGTARPAEYFAPDEVCAFLQNDTTLYRVLPLNYERSDDGILMLNGIHSTGGQMPNPLQSYQDFIGAGSSVLFAAGNLLQPNFMNLANVKYIITVPLPENVSGYDQRTQDIIAQLRAYFSQPRFIPVFQGRRYAIYENLSCLPRAFLVSGYELLPGKDEVISRLMDPGFDPARTALLYDNPGFTSPPDSFFGSAEITQYDCNAITVHYRSSTPALLILSENYHPDWKATVDQKPVPVLRAYHTFRAVPVPAGEHVVSFRYDARWYTLGGIATLASLVFLALTLIVWWLGNRTSRRKTSHV